MTEPVNINPSAVSSAMGNVQHCLESTRNHVQQMTEILENVKGLHQSENAAAIQAEANHLEEDLNEILKQMTMTRNEVFDKGNALLTKAGAQPMSHPGD